MKTKIFNSTIVMVCLLAIGQASLAQQGTATVTPATPAYDSKEYREQMRKLQDQMRELQKQMNSLRGEEQRKNAEAMRELSRKMKGTANYSYTYSDNVSGGSKGVGVTAATGTTTNTTTATTTFTRVDGDDYIAKKVKSGEIKEKTKAYTKIYSIDGGDKIQIDNTYGRVTIVTWPRKEVKVDVQIKADADDDDDAQKLLDEVSIRDSKDDSGVSFRTQIDMGDERNWGTWLSGGKSHVHKVDVNYTVYMPAKNQLDIKNKFGGVKIPDMSGKLTLNLSYGNLVAEQLTNPLNDLTIKFGDANIETLFSDALNISYGTATVGTADKLKAKVSFSSLSVDKLKSSGDITLKYKKGGYGFKVGELDRNLKALTVDASFSSVLLNGKDDFDFDITTKMGNFNYDTDGAVNISSKTPADGERGFSFTKTYKGHAGKGGSDKTVTIKSSYTTVKLD